MRRALAGLVAAALGLAPLAASAQPVEAEIRRLGAEAAERFQAGDHAKALVAYEEVDRLLGQLEGREVELAYVRYNLARCHDELGHGEQALAAYERVSTEHLPPDHALEVDRRAEALEARLFGTLVVDCGLHADARVALPELKPGDRACGTPWRRVPPGPYRLVAQRDDGGRVELRVTVQAGVEGLVRIPWTDAAVPTAAGPDRTVAWALTGAGLAVLAAGGVFNVLARNDVGSGDSALDRQRVASTVEQYDRAVRDTDAAYDRAEERALASYVLLGAGAALAVGATWAWLTGDEPAPAPSGGAGLVGARW